MLKEDYQKDINDITVLIVKYCINKNYEFESNYPYFTIDVSELKRERRLIHRFTIHMMPSLDLDILKLSHNGFNDIKFITDIPLHLNINSIIPYIVINYIDSIILFRRKTLEMEDLYDNYKDFNKKINDPIYIRDLKLNEILC